MGSVAISTAIWAGVVIIIGINFGPRVVGFLALHSWMYLAWGAIVVAVVGWQVVRARMAGPRASPVEEAVGR